VPAGGDLQAALNAAEPGDEIILTAGGIYTGNFVLPVKPLSTFITVRSSRCGELPLGVRVNPSQSGLMAQVVTPNVMPVISAPVWSHHWRFQCLEFTQSSTVGQWGYNLIQLGGAASYENQTTLESAPHHLEFDRVIIRARDASTALQRGVTLNSAYTTISNSYISDIKWLATETQAIGGWNGPGPFLIENNFIEAAGINILFGGTVPTIPDLVPSDIVIRGNTLSKRLEWLGRGYGAKNLLELKNARRVNFTDNTASNSWPDGQTGWAVVLNAFADAPQNVVEDVELSRNVFTNVSNGINLRGMDTGDTVTRMRRVHIADNRIEGLGAFNGEGKAFQILNGTESVTIDHNTISGVLNNALILDSFPIAKHVGFRFMNNLMPHGIYGVFGGGFFGSTALNTYAINWTCAGNALFAKPVDPAASLYPPGNFFPATESEAISLLGTDGLPVGVRTQGSPSPTPTPIPTPVNAPPSVTLVDPLANAVFVSGQNVRIAAIASDPDGSVVAVDFYQNGTPLGTSRTAPYSLTWIHVPTGRYQLTARAFDNRGAVVISAAITISVNNSLRIMTTGDDDSGTVVALNSMTHKAGLFEVTTETNLGSDKRTRLNIFATGITATAVNTDTSNDVNASGVVIPNYAESVMVEARLSDGRVYNLPVEFAGPQGTIPWLDQVNLMLIPQLQGAGRVVLTLVVGGQRSNAPAIVIQ
jgi:hypothetical protein